MTTVRVWGGFKLYMLVPVLGIMHGMMSCRAFKLCHAAHLPPLGSIQVQHA